MIQNLTCFKCHKNTASLTYEENRIYKVSCPCGCEYDFEHSSMKCAEEYHYKMVELHREIDRAKQLQQENEQLKELLRLAVDGVRNRCNYCINCDEHSESKKCKDCQSNGFGRGCLNKWQWQHADKLKGLIEI